MRGRITVTSVVYLLLALAALAAFWPVLNTMIDGVTPLLDARESLLYNTMLPAAVLVILGVVYVEAKSGLKR